MTLPERLFILSLSVGAVAILVIGGERLLAVPLETVARAGAPVLVAGTVLFLREKRRA